MNQSWQSAAAYERFMGRWSALLARPFLAWLAAPPGRTWLDVGCGTGSLTRGILETCQPSQIIAIDSSPVFITHARQRIASPIVHFQTGLAQSLDLASQSIDAVVSGLVLNFIPQPQDALGEMLRVVRPGGSIGIFVWDYAEGMQMLRHFWDAAVELDPSARQFDEGVCYPVCLQGGLEDLVREAGISRFEAAAIEAPTVFESFDDYWQPFLGKVGHAPVYITGLEQDHIRQIEAKLRQSLPMAADGSISLPARAWAIKITA